MLPDFGAFVNYKRKKSEDPLIKGDFSPPLLGAKPQLMGPPAPDELKLDTQDNKPNFDISDAMYAQPRTEEYLQHLRERPVREDYPTSFGRKLGATLLSMITGTPNAAIANPKLNKARELWQDTGAGLKEGAQFEQKDIVQRRLRLADMLRQARAQNNYQAKMLKINNDHMDRMQKIEELDKPELERKKLRDQEMSRHYGEMSDLRKQALQEQTYQGRARLAQGQQRLNIAQDRASQVSPLDQARIEKQAHLEVAKDPRFGEWYNSKRDAFGDKIELDANGNEVVRNGQPSVKEAMPDELKPMLQQALAAARDKVSKMHRSNYAAGAMGDEEVNSYLDNLGFGGEIPEFLRDENQ